MNTLDFLNANKHENSFLAHAQFVKENWHWLKYSYAIAVIVKRRMTQLGVTQALLAEMMSCSQQHVSTLLKGKVNMTLETIAKLEDALQIELLSNLISYTVQDSVPAILNDSGGQDDLHGIKTSSLVEGYSPRRKKGPKQKTVKSEEKEGHLEVPVPSSQGSFFAPLRETADLPGEEMSMDNIRKNRSNKKAR